MNDDLNPAESPSDVVYYVVAGIYGLLALSAFLLNTPVLITFAKERLFNQPSHRLILSMTVADWLQVVLAYPLGVVVNLSRGWRLGEMGCVWYAFITSFLAFGTMLHHAVFAVERALIMTFTISNFTVLGNINYVIFGLWLFALLWSICPLIGWSEYVPEGASMLCSIRWQTSDSGEVVFIICIFCLFFFVPILVMIISYVSIYRLVKKITKNARAMWGKAAAPTLDAVRAETRTARMGSLMSFCFLLAWLPYACVSLYAVISMPENIPPLLTIFPALFSKTAACYNPIIYFFMLKTFRDSLRKTFKALRTRIKKETNAENTDHSSTTVHS